MADGKIGKSYVARKQLFAKGIRTGQLTIQEIEEALPPGTLTAAERWLLYYSLKAAGVDIVDAVTGEVDAEPLINQGDGEPARG